jgi:tRNA threonylcarbamoyladenosine modification (KEOPS) complex Cgi121 subunit
MDGAMSDFGKEVRELWKQGEEADSDNRAEAILDLKFEGYDQWDEKDRKLRELRELPCITINFVQQYTNMVVGDWLQNETSIKVLPRDNGTTAVADVRSELIRSIELQSKADRIYTSSLAQMVACGISNFRVDVDYAYEDAFDQDILFRDIPDPLAVMWDPLAFDPTGRDAGWCFVGDELTKAEYKRLYPDAAEPKLISRDAGSNWAKADTVLVPEFWKIVEKLRTFGLTVDGKTVDLTGMPQRKWPRIAVDPETKQKIIRENAKCKYAVRVMTNGVEELTDPYELKLSRLPIIRVMGRETRVEGRRIRSGMIRAMRDSQRLKNYARSIRAELLMKAARVNFVAEARSVEGREADWDNVLTYNDNTPKPEEVTNRNLAALVNEENFYSQDMKEVTGLHEASRGAPGNETSGTAIVARQNEGDVATAIFHANMTSAQEEAGEVANELIDQVYDIARTVRVVGPDLAVKMVRVNDPSHQKNVDLTLGKYGVTISTGPSFASRRQEGVAQLMELARIDPRIAEVGGDIIVGEMDLVNGQQLQERIKRAMPPQILGDDANDDKSPEELAQQQAAAAEAKQMQQMGVALEMQSKQADTELKQAQARKAVADAEQSEANALKAKFEAMQLAQGGDDEAANRLQIEGYNAITNRLKVVGAVTPDSPPSLEEHLAPIVAQLVGEALKQHFGIGADQGPQEGLAA